MAVSRFSQIFRPSEYVSPFDLGSYASLINRRQQLFDVNQSTAENKLQSIIDLPVMRDVDRQHVNGLVQKTTEEINSLGSMNYSDPTVMRQIMNGINSITQDAGVINALSSAQMYNSDEKEIEAAKKKGTGYSPANELPIRQAQQAWLSSGDLGASYSKMGYTPHAPYDKDLTEKAKTATLLDEIEISTVDPNDPSKQVIQKVKTSTLSKSRIIELLSKTLTPEQQNQMRLDANYRYRGADDNFYIQGMSQYVGQQIGQLDSDIKMVTDARTAYINSSGPSADIKAFDEKIASFTNQKQLLEAKLQNRDALLTEARGDNNFEGLRTWVYKNDYMSGMATGYQGLKKDITTNVINLEEGKNADGTTKKNEIETTLSYVTLPDTDGDHIGNITKSHFINEVNNANSTIVASREAAWKDLANWDPIYKNKTEAEKQALFNGWQESYNNHDFKSIPKQIAEHFDKTSLNKTRANLASQIIDKVSTKLKTDPEYQKALNGLASMEKILPKEVPVSIGISENGKPKDLKKTYSRDAIINFNKSLLQSQQGSSRRITKPLPVQEGDNTMIADINNELKNSAMQGFDTNPKIGLKDFFIKPKDFRTIDNPLYDGEPGNPYSPPGQTAYTNLKDFTKYFNSYSTVKSFVNRKESSAYKELGYINLVPAVTLSEDKKVQDKYVNPVKLLRSAYGDNDGVITSVSALQGLANGSVRITYDTKTGNEVEQKTMDVPRESLGSLNELYPQDDNEVFQENIKHIGGTSENIKDAPVVKVGDDRIPYRVVSNSNGTLSLQFFTKDGKLDLNNKGLPEFRSLYDLNMHLQRIAQEHIKAAAVK